MAIKLKFQPDKGSWQEEFENQQRVIHGVQFGMLSLNANDETRYASPKVDEDWQRFKARKNVDA